MPTVVTTIGGSASNAYVSVAAGDTYFGERLNASSWTGGETADKEKAVIMATRRIDAEDFVGVRKNPGTDTETSGTQQALAWPRQNATTPDGWTYDDDEIPVIVQHATLELALKLLNDGTTDAFADSGLGGFDSVKVGPISVEVRHAQRAGALPDHVRRLLRPVLSTPSRANLRLVRG